MSSLAASLAAILSTVVPPGGTAYSVEPAADGKHSSFYGTTVRRESAETARARYRVIADVMVEQAAAVLTETGSKNFTLPELVALTAGVAIQESGLREDVMVGRGRSGKPDDADGEGRGPGNEACLMQIHPSIGWRFAPDIDDATRRAGEKGDRAAREAVMVSLLGSDRDALARCFRTGIRMLVHGARFCDGKAPSIDQGAVAIFVTGRSCVGSDTNKTAVRVSLARRIHQKLVGAGGRKRP